jgi:hypothetical protein
MTWDIKDRRSFQTQKWFATEAISLRYLRRPKLKEREGTTGINLPEGGTDCGK